MSHPHYNNNDLTETFLNPGLSNLYAYFGILEEYKNDSRLLLLAEIRTGLNLRIIEALIRQEVYYSDDEQLYFVGEDARSAAVRKIMRLMNTPTAQEAELDQRTQKITKACEEKSLSLSAIERAAFKQGLTVNIPLIREIVQTNEDLLPLFKLAHINILGCMLKLVGRELDFLRVEPEDVDFFSPKNDLPCFSEIFDHATATYDRSLRELFEKAD